MRAKIDWALAMVSSLTCAIRSSAALPSLRVGFAHDDMQADAEAQLPSSFRGKRGDRGDLLGDLRRRLAPGQIFVDGIGGDVDRSLGRAAEIKRGPRLLHRREKQPAVFDADVLAVDIHLLAGEECGVNGEKFARNFVAFVMVEKNPVALVLRGIAAGDDVDQQPALRHAIERRRHAGRDRRRLQSRPHRDEVSQPLRERRERRRDDPGIFAAASGRQQHAEIAEIVGRLRDLAQVLKADRTGANGGAEMVAVAMGRQEPKDVGVGRRNDAHEAGFLTALETTTCLGISPSA